MELLYLLDILSNIVTQIKNTLRFASIEKKDDVKKPFIHFTKFEYFGDMVVPNFSKDKKDNEQCRFPVFDTAFMNDPREGAAFCDLIFRDFPDLEQFYTDNCSFFKSIKEKKDMTPTFVFLKSFMCKEPDDNAIKHMWKLYGDEGRGVRINFDLETFLNRPLSELKSEHKSDDYSLYNIRYLERDKSKIEDNYNYLIEENYPKSLLEEQMVNLLAIVEPEEDDDEIIKIKGLSASILTLRMTLEKIRKLYPSLNEKERTIFDKVTGHYIAQVAYLFKDKSSEKGKVWKNEKEVRLVLYRSEKEKAIKEKGKKNQHIYLPNPVKIKKIELGEKIKALIEVTK